MSKYAKLILCLMAVPVVVSLAGCPAMAAARVAKKVSENNKDSSTTTSTSTSGNR